MIESKPKTAWSKFMPSPVEGNAREPPASLARKVTFLVRAYSGRMSTIWLKADHIIAGYTIRLARRGAPEDPGCNAIRFRDFVDFPL